MDGGVTLFLYELATLVIVVACVEFAERRWPAYPINRRHKIGLNFLALFVVIIGSKTSDHILLETLAFINFDALVRPLVWLRELSAIPKMALTLFSVDFCLYWVHRSMHDIDLFWRAHKFHHTPKMMFWLAGSRTSFLHLFMFAIPQMIIPFYIMKISLSQATVLFSFSVIINIWVHSNLRVNIGPLKWLLITPNYHRVHHASDNKSRKNLGFIHTLWDRLFGTYLNPETVEKGFTLGSSEESKISATTIFGI